MVSCGSKTKILVSFGSRTKNKSKLFDLLVQELKSLYKPINERVVYFMLDCCYLALSFEDADVCMYLASLNNDYNMLVYYI